MLDTILCLLGDPLGAAIGGAIVPGNLAGGGALFAETRGVVITTVVLVLFLLESPAEAGKANSES